MGELLSSIFLSSTAPTLYVGNSAARLVSLAHGRMLRVGPALFTLWLKSSTVDSVLESPPLQSHLYDEMSLETI